MQKYKINYSVIIPHKNTPQLLSNCISTIPVRNDVEIIIVDDGSDPKIVDFSNFPGKDNPNVKYIFSKGESAGQARNKALEIAKGKWIVFADADDFFSSDINSIFDRFAEDEKTDMVFLNAKSIDDNGIIKSIILNKYISNYINNRPCALSILKYGFWAPWSRMIKLHVFQENNIKFENCKTGNDMMAIICASLHSHVFDCVPEVIYYYYKPTGGSQTHIAYDEISYYQRLDQRLRLYKIYDSCHYKFKTPIFHIFTNKTYNKSIEAKKILKKYKHSRLKDILLWPMFLAGKFLHLT